METLSSCDLFAMNAGCERVAALCQRQNKIPHPHHPTYSYMRAVATLTTGEFTSPEFFPFARHARAPAQFTATIPPAPAPAYLHPATPPAPALKNRPAPPSAAARTIFASRAPSLPAPASPPSDTCISPGSFRIFFRDTGQNRRDRSSLTSELRGVCQSSVRRVAGRLTPPYRRASPLTCVHGSRSAR